VGGEDSGKRLFIICCINSSKKALGRMGKLSEATNENS